MPNAQIPSPAASVPVDRLTLCEAPARGAAPALRGCEPCMWVALAFADD